SFLPGGNNARVVDVDERVSWPAPDDDLTRLRVSMNRVLSFFRFSSSVSSAVICFAFSRTFSPGSLERSAISFISPVLGPVGSSLQSSRTLNGASEIVTATFFACRRIAVFGMTA
ncbi:hypothetical protein PFISCL1PPCAC_27773, partial [Pristionchus fissidentatus]